ncbi:tellurite resistance TerB family protein [Bartonella tamiae]|uniref:DUF533 domain-containing protein n=1 Tax=Bartonella tamiae Th239 TaxID=1094558 RepID=J0QTV3_9HYPH|nr:tellurite resistance TerB family protein [Bartonella tamiae]EJF89336.1 hypothetical protein ME5_01887 [Bartonella tamiae Th239]EJF92799.1 hypothetical protein MEG_01969 [Bartonella tamiae Th307]
MLDAKKIFSDLLKSQDSGVSDQKKEAQSTMSQFSVGDFIGSFFGSQNKGNIFENLIKGGGLTAIASVAFDALKNYQQQSGQQSNTCVEDKSGNNQNEAFSLTLIRAMIQAAKADGRVDESEQQLIQEKISEMNLDKQTSQFLITELEKPVDLDALVHDVQTDTQKTELYVASRMALDPDKPKERDYLNQLTQKLSLPADLLDHIEQAMKK